MSTTVDPGEHPCTRTEPYRPKETEKAITRRGWFKSGDAGYLDAEGYLYIHDRAKDAKERLATFRCPTSGDWIDALPAQRQRTGGSCRDLREPFWAGHNRRVG